MRPSLKRRFATSALMKDLFHLRIPIPKPSECSGVAQAHADLNFRANAKTLPESNHQKRSGASPFVVTLQVTVPTKVRLP